MAKTIRSHPTSPFILPEPIFWTTLIFSKFGPKMDLLFFAFSDLPISKKTTHTPLPPKGKKMRMDHPFILDVCHNLIFYVVFITIFNCLGKTHFLQLLSYFDILCISDSNMGDPKLLLFQNRTLISK